MGIEMVANAFAIFVNIVQEKRFYRAGITNLRKLRHQ